MNAIRRRWQVDFKPFNIPEPEGHKDAVRHLSDGLQTKVFSENLSADRPGGYSVFGMP
jgi:hypothetical protein